MTLRVSVTLPQFRDDPAPLLEAARRAEELGFDGVYVFDHLFPLGGRRRPIFEGLTALGAVTAATRRVTVGTLVARAPIRPAWTTAKAAWTAQVVSTGRLTLGLGAADSLSRPEFEAYGLDFGSVDQRLAHLRATIEALAAPELAAPGYERPKVWIGGRSPAVRRLAADIADGWNGWGGGPDRLATEAAEVRSRADRPFEVSWGGQVLLAPDAAALARRLEERSGTGESLVGVPAVIADQLSGLAASGANELVLSLLPSQDWDAWELFSEAVRPLL